MDDRNEQNRHAARDAVTHRYTKAAQAKPREISGTDHELIIPDEQAYARHPVVATDDEEMLLLKYRRAQIDTMMRLTLTTTAEELKEAMKSPSIWRQVKEHNARMMLNVEEVKVCVAKRKHRG